MENGRGKDDASLPVRKLVKAEEDHDQDSSGKVEGNTPSSNEKEDIKDKTNVISREGDEPDTKRGVIGGHAASSDTSDENAVDDFYKELRAEQKLAVLERVWDPTEPLILEHQIVTQGDHTFSYRVTRDEEPLDGEEYAQTLIAICKEGGVEIGRCFGSYINRDALRIDPEYDLRSRVQATDCADLQGLCLELFDRCGYLQKRFRTVPAQRGTGVWGAEPGHGSFFLIERILVKMDWRRQKIGTQLVELLLDKVISGKRNPAFFFVLPDGLKDGMQFENAVEASNARPRAIAFWRSLGFRRIGASDFFARAVDPDHPAWKIVPGGDYERIQPDEAYITSLKERLPLHWAVINREDAQCVQYFEERRSQGASATEWDMKDIVSNNVLHLAATYSKPKTIKWLVHQSNKGRALVSARNIFGSTPYEVRLVVLEPKRSIPRDSDMIMGFSPADIRILADLQNLRQPTPKQVARMQYGCTCGSCIDGFLSPRMRLALWYEAVENHGDGDVQSTGELPDGLTMVEDGFIINENRLADVPKLYERVAILLRNVRPPTTTNVVVRDSKNEQVAGNDFLKVFFGDAQRADDWVGTGSLMKRHGDEFKALPECRNDREFEYVARICGCRYIAQQQDC